MTDGFGIGGFAGLPEPFGSVGPETPPEPPVSTADLGDVVGLLEAMTGAIGESDGEIGGIALTRLTTDVAAADTVFPVETTLDWPDEGKLALDGVLYYYTGKTDYSFTGITYIASESPVSGAAKAHKLEAPVADINKQRSALELLRRAILVNYAEGPDLSVVGRNIGVPRLPILSDDEIYRNVIKAVAYSPKGTLFGLELALEAFVGAGNFTIYEDLMRYPNTVFLSLLGTYFISDQSQGKSFTNRISWDTLGVTYKELTLDREPITVGSVKLKDLGAVFDFRNDIPSAVLYEYLPGGAPIAAWSYEGSIAEGSAVTQVPGSHTNLKAVGGVGSVWHSMWSPMGAHLFADSEVEINAVLRVPTGAVLSPGALGQMSLTIGDGAFTVGAGLSDALAFGLYSDSAGAHIGPTVTLALDQWYNVALKKQGTSGVELWVDGKLVSRQTYSAFTNASIYQFLTFGMGWPGVSVAQDMEVDFKQIAAKVVNHTEYWGAGGSGTGDVLAANPTQLVVSGYPFQADDEGKRLDIRGSGVANPQGGNNNGSFLIDSYVDPTTVELIGFPKDEAVLDIVNPERITVPGDHEAFVYPDDLGKKITISGSVSGNDGDYVIAKILEMGSLVDLATFLTTRKTYSNVCEVVAAAFNSEPNLDYQLSPIFVDESGLDWEQSDAGSFSGTDITLRQPLWGDDIVMEITHTEVLSSQLLKDETVGNLKISAIPLKYEYYPLYLSDVLGELQQYLDTLTAAGVIPEFRLQE